MILKTEIIPRISFILKIREKNRDHNSTYNYTKMLLFHIVQVSIVFFSSLPTMLISPSTHWPIHFWIDPDNTNRWK